MKMSRSLERYKFQMEKAMNRKDATSLALLKMYEELSTKDMINEQDLDWQKNNLEYDLRTTDWILGKARHSVTYAQNLYAALCNNQFQKAEMWPILKDQRWSCSWRHAGGIVADMTVKGDYMDWYCSGMGSGLGNGDEDGSLKYVVESTVTEEIEADLLKLGWITIKDEEE
jgi:hypothetical protein